MAIFDKFQQLAATRRAMDASGIRSISVVMDRVVSATEAFVRCCELGNFIELRGACPSPKPPAGA